MLIAPEIIASVLDHSNRRGSYHHGEKHWRAVAQAGWYIANAERGVDAEVVLLFGLLHDTRRENEFSDPDHGLRAAARLFDVDDPASQISDHLGPRRTALLTLALMRHNGATPDEVWDPTVAACLDADRLNLWRVGKTPRPDLLCTDFARRPEVIEWARALCWSYCPPFASKDRPDFPILTWSQLVQAYSALPTQVAV